MAKKRFLLGEVIASGKDHENFGSDEFLRGASQEIREVLTVGDHERPIVIHPFRWGGECRLEVHVQAICNDNGTVQVFGHTAFFEGDSEDTPHERDREIINFHVLKNGADQPNPTVQSWHMQSGSDTADVTFSLTNTTAEDGGGD